MKLFIGNKSYSSWSLRGWLAAKHSGVPFEEIVVPLYDQDWDQRREGAEFAPSSGKVPILWDDDEAVVWDSLAIIDYLDARTDGERGYWPTARPALAMARSMAAEMHSSYTALRRAHSMNIRRIFPPQPISAEVEADVTRILQLWAEARARFGGNGEFLFGAWGAVDIMFAPVVTRFLTYSIPVPRFAIPYMQAVISHPHMQEWIGGAQAEDWVIEKFEGPSQG
ncbi:MAG: hypothetical protein RLZZ58_2028 [Pseudomonadota bacterium]